MKSNKLEETAQKIDNVTSRLSTLHRDLRLAGTDEKLITEAEKSMDELMSALVLVNELQAKVKQFTANL